MECPLCEFKEKTDRSQFSVDDIDLIFERKYRDNIKYSKCSASLDSLHIRNYIKTFIESRPNLLKNQNACKSLVSIICETHCYDGFKSLISMLQLSRNSDRGLICVCLFKTWIKNDFLFVLLNTTLNLEDELWDENLSNSHTYWSNLITWLVSLPSRIHNEGYSTWEERKDFYSIRLYESLISLLEYICIGSQNMVKKASFYFERLVLSGHQFHVFTNPKLSKRLLNNFTNLKSWNSIFTEFLKHINSSFYEKILFHSIFSLNASEFIILFKELILEDLSSFTYILFDLFVFRNSYVDFSFARKLVWVYCAFEELQKELNNTIFKIIKFLSSGNNFKSISYEKLYYLTSVLLLTFGDKKFQLSLNVEFMTLGQVVLETVDMKKASLGRFLVSELTKHFTVKLKSLKLQFKTTPEIEELQNLIGSENSAKSALPDEDSETDSDDFEENIDLSVEYVGDCLVPFYLRDCLTGLSSEEDSFKVEAYLIGCSRLVCKRPSELCVLSQELTAILLFDANKYEISHLRKLRIKSLEDLATYDPERVVPYLILEFYKNNCNIAQKNEILQILQASSSALSKMESYPNSLTLPLSAHSLPSSICSSASKSGTSLFDKYSNLFFFPLLKDFDKNFSNCDLLREPLVLIPLIKTLQDIILLINRNDKIFNYVKSFLEFLSNFVHLDESTLKKAILYSLITCLTKIDCLNYEEKAEIIELFKPFLNWIEDLSKFDCDTDIQNVSQKILDCFKS